MLTINQELKQGRYRITKQFGQGKTISYYEAHDKNLEKNILLKKILINLHRDKTPAQQEVQNNEFAVEAKFLTEIKNEGFLQVLDYFYDVDSQYLIMELVDGKNIGETIKKGDRSFALSDLVDWGEQLLDALDYLHKHTPPIIYFNIKPLNVHLTSRGKIKLLATGIASRINSNANITKQAFDAANLNYSPLELIWENLDSASRRAILNGYDERSEQILMQQPDVRSDIYSLGATLYHLLTGKLPVDALERSITILEGDPDPLPAPNEVDANISIEISDVLMKALKIRRENRFESALEMRKELENAFTELKERKSSELRNEVPAAPSVPFVKPNLPEQKLQDVQKEIPKINTEENNQLEAKKPEEKDQLEFIKQKLREAEEQKILAEQRAAEAEKRLLEIKTQEIKETAEISAKLQENLEQLPEPTEIENQVSEEEVWQEAFAEDSLVQEFLSEEISNKDQENASDEFQNLFAQPQNDNKFIKKLAIAAFGVLVLGGGIFGVLNFLPSAFGGQEKVITNQTLSVTEPTAEPQPSVETLPLIEPEAKPEMSETLTSGETLEARENVPETAVKPAPTKETPALPQIATIKTPDSPKRAVTENQKKKVTVDDLINDAPTTKKKVTVDDLINDN